MGNSRLQSIAFVVCGGLFGLAIARAVLDTAPLLAGPLPRWPLALLSALAFAAAGLRLARSNLPPYITLP
ncbi:MAG: hypothetical protein AAB382_05675, partial [Chloroflexota bacterium]